MSKRNVIHKRGVFLNRKEKITSFRYTCAIDEKLQELSTHLAISKSEVISFAVMLYHDEIFGSQIMLDELSRKSS